MEYRYRCKNMATNEAIEKPETISVKSLLAELKRTGETYEYTAQGYFTSANQWNEIEITDKNTGDVSKITVPSYGLPNRDEWATLYLNPRTRAHTQFKEYLSKNEDFEGALKNREFKLVFRARPSNVQENAAKGLYVLELYRISVTDKVYDTVGFPELMENKENSPADSTEEHFNKVLKNTGQTNTEERIQPSTQKKVIALLKAGDLGIPPAIADGTMTEAKAKNLLKKLLLME